MTRFQMAVFVANFPTYWALTPQQKQIGYARSIRPTVLPGLTQREKEAAFKLLYNPSSGLQDRIWRMIGEFRRDTGIQVCPNGMGNDYLILDHRTIKGLPVRSLNEMMFRPRAELVRVYEVLQKFDRLYGQILETIRSMCASVNLAG